MRRRVDLERFGTWLMVLITVLTLAALGVFGVLKSVAEDLHLQNAISFHQADPGSHWPPGKWLSARLADDLALNDTVAVEARAGEFDHRSDRVVEATAVLALVGVLVGLLTTRPADAPARTRAETTTPLANTMSNGKV
jgi:hypothetical protein